KGWSPPTGRRWATNGAGPPRRRTPRPPLRERAFPAAAGSDSGARAAYLGKTGCGCPARREDRCRRTDTAQHARPRRRTRAHPSEPPARSPALRGSPSESRSRTAVLREDAQQILAVPAFLQWRGQPAKLLGVDEPHPKRDFLGTGDLEALPLLDRL